MDQLIRQRGGCKSVITSTKTWLDKNANVLLDFDQYDSKRDMLVKTFHNFSCIQYSIEELDDTQQNVRDEVTEEFFDTLSRLNSILRKLSPQANPVLTATTSQNTSFSQPNQFANSVKLPEINIPPFLGEISEFPAFFEMFDTLIAQNAALSNVQKLIYLKSYLKQEPLNLINNLALISDNFEVAVNILKQRYENKFLIINSHLKNLIELPSLQKCTTNNLREFLTKIKQNVESLKNLKLPVDQWDIILIYIFCSKLDYNSRKAFEVERKSDVLPTLKEFQEFLEKRCSVLENISPGIQIPRSSEKFMIKKSSHFSSSFSSDKNKHSSNFRANSQVDISKNNTTCIFCNQSGHKIYNCQKFIDCNYSQKSEFIRKKCLCRNCLGFHDQNECRSLRKCLHCNKSHHSLLHYNSQNHSRNNQNNSRKTDNFSFHQKNAINSGTNQSQSKYSDLQQSSSFQVSTTNRVTENSDSDLDIGQFCDKVDASTSRQGSQKDKEKISISACNFSQKEILLATALVTLYSVNEKPVTVKALLDCGSQTSFITKELAEKLGFYQYKSNLQILGISDNCSASNAMTDITIHSRLEQGKSFSVSCAILPKITCSLPLAPLKSDFFPIPSDIELADPSFGKPMQIHLLFGADVYYDLTFGERITLGVNLPVLEKTHLGWVIAGNVPTYMLACQSSSKKKNKQNISLFAQTVNIDELIQNFWAIEEIPKKSLLTPDEELASNIFSNTTKILKNGSFQINLPLKSADEHLKLGDSFTMARKRYFNLEKRFEKDPELFIQYKGFINEYVHLGHARYIPLSIKNKNNEFKYFLPHHCVLREESLTTKLRVVFDGSMKTTSGYSLNDILLKGFIDQPELFDILCRFRMFNFVIICDIEKMFRKIFVNPEQTFLQNILWRENPNQDLECIELSTVTYGTTSAPFLATQCLNFLANEHKEKFPLASEAVLTQCYIDDILYGCNSEQQLFCIKDQLTELFKIANINLHKWSSNSFSFLEQLNSHSHDQIDYDIKQNSVSSKVLGISWNPTLDIFSISLPKNLNKNIVTKRQVLSTIAQMFDPLGFIGPVIVTAKIIMQKIWLAKLDWDDSLTGKLLSEWNIFFNSIESLSDLKIPRNLFFQKQIVKFEIQGFCDASQLAYGACVYIRAIYQDNSVSCSLLTSKSRVAPLKSLSLPRLELCAALLLSNLSSRVVDIFKNKLKFDSINLWTDSQIVLCWLKSHSSRWTTFVSNRISEIQQLTSNYQWRHIKSRANPADILSRGILANEILNHTLWWNGPSFLKTHDLNPKLFELVEFSGEIPEEKRVTHFSKKENTDCEDILCNFSSYVRLQRVLAYSLRFLHNSKPNSIKFKGPLTVEELKNSEEKIIKILQNKYFHNEIELLHSGKQITNKALLSLNPFLDSWGILRVGGRLSHSSLSYDQKFPILLPSKNYVVRLLLKSEHIRFFHAGAQNTLSNIRLRFWPLDGLREIKRVIRNCKTCFRFKAQPQNQLMSDLPKHRITISRPFQQVGVDFGGPFLIKTSKLKKAPLTKGYMAMFICMVTKAVHIELVSGLSTNEFLLTLKRFISRRGNPSVIFSDNATNFLGSSNQLHEIFKFFKNKSNLDSIHNYLSSNEIQWKFIPPRSPHWGGIWEAAIKGAKHHIYRIVGNSHLTFEEMSTVLAQIEAIMNSRPLCPLSNDPSDLSCLTPGHFLIGTNLTAYPERTLTEVPSARLSCWQRYTQMHQLFWKRWSTEYLNRLQNRPKWLKSSSNLKVDDIVLIKEDNTSPLSWPLGRIVQVLPGRDNKVRVVKVRTKDGIFTRSIVKICPLPSDDQNILINSYASNLS